MFGHRKGFVMYLGKLEDVDSSKLYHKIVGTVWRECMLWYGLEEAASGLLCASNSSITPQAP